MRKILTLSICLFAFTFSWSQEEVKRIEYGISLLPHVGTLLSGEGNGKGLLSLGYGIELGINKLLAKNLEIQSGINFQKTTLRQRFNNFRWPDDNENGEWVPGRSHEQYEVEYYALGFTAGVNLKLSQKQNYWSITGSGTVRQVFNEKDKLIINESGHFTEYGSDEIDTELNKTQFFIAGGASYNFGIGQKNNRLAIGPVFEYALTDLLAVKTGTWFWNFEGGKPVLIYLKASYFISATKS